MKKTLLYVSVGVILGAYLLIMTIAGLLPAVHDMHLFPTEWYWELTDGTWLSCLTSVPAVIFMAISALWITLRKFRKGSWIRHLCLTIGVANAILCVLSIAAMLMAPADSNMEYDYDFLYLSTSALIEIIMAFVMFVVLLKLDRKKKEEDLV